MGPMTTTASTNLSRPAAGARVVVIGGSVAGLATGLILAGHGAEVVVVERDAPAEPAATWRRGVPQARHSHACLALGWLRQAGIRPPFRRVENCGVVYFSR